MHKPWKGIIPAASQEASKRICQPHQILRAAAKAARFYAFVLLLPVNGSMYSLNVI